MDRIKTLIMSSPLIITLIYIVIGSVWIQYSDQFVLSIFNDPEALTRSQSYKGWFFVFASGVLIFLLVWKNNSILGNTISELQKNRDKFEATFEEAPVGIVHHRPNEKWLRINQTLCDILGYSKDELLMLDFEDFIHPADLKKGRDLDLDLINKRRRRYSIEKRYKKKNGTYITGRLTKSAVFNGEKNHVYLVATIEDITPEKKAEKKIKQALEQKEILLAEIQHRVRNNLALISALFELQSMHTDNKQVHSILHSSKMRIKCLSLIHETFSSSDKAASINFSDCLTDLINFMPLTKNNHQSKILLTKDIQSIRLNINQAIPIGLMCNELLLIAEKNNFNKIKSPELDVSLREQWKKITLKISDNGKGIAKKEDFENLSGLEYVIIKTLVSQVNGEMNFYENDSKKTFEVSFIKKNPKGPGSSIHPNKI